SCRSHCVHQCSEPYSPSTISSLLSHATTPTEIYTLSLHDALPISSISRHPTPPPPSSRAQKGRPCNSAPPTLTPPNSPTRKPARSEEHTSELQSRSDLVCRLLLEKKKKKLSTYLYDAANNQCRGVT